MPEHEENTLTETSFRPLSGLGCKEWLGWLALLGSIGCVWDAQTPGPVYDLYEQGVHNAVLTLDAGGNDGRLTIRRRDRETNLWQEEVAAGIDEVEGNEEFRLPGSLGSLAANLEKLQSVPWGSLEAVGWPDRDRLYLRHRKIEAVADGVSRAADYWALEDASNPLDLVIINDGRDGRDGRSNVPVIAGIDPTQDVILVRRGYENFTLLKDWAGVSEARFGYRSLGQTMVSMPDGVGLSTLVYLPDDGTDGPYPVVFIRTPYGIGELIDRYWHYCARGYALVLQACRGTCYWDPKNRSEGTWELCINEVADGARSLDWIAQQPWCNGKIGMQGGSYVGYTQWTAAMSRHPALRCIIPEVSMGTVFSDQPYLGGGFVSGIAYYSLYMMNQSLLEGRTWTDVLRHRPLVEIDSFATGHDLPQWNALFEHQSNDAYWRRQDWYRSEEPRDFASLQITGWFDDDFLGTRRNWEMMKRYGRQPQRLIVGPWKHGYNRDRRLNGFSFGNDALRGDIWLIKQKWYDRFLRGRENDVEAPRVEYFVLGANEWRSADAWPPQGAELRPWFFHSTGDAPRSFTDGTLAQSPPEGKEPRDVYRYDPRDPAPNWMSFEQMTRWEDLQTFPYDFRDIEGRHDIVTYTSDPLEEDLTIAGDLMAVLYASCDVRDTDWWVHLSDVHPDGQSVRLSVGLLRARFRNLEDPQFQVFGSNFEREELLSGDPAEVVRYEIALPSVAATFRKGHRLRVAVSNACDNYTFPNSNTGADEGTVTRSVAATMAVHHSRDYPSHVLLPVLRQ